MARSRGQAVLEAIAADGITDVVAQCIAFMPSGQLSQGSGEEFRKVVRIRPAQDSGEIFEPDLWRFGSSRPRRPPKQTTLLLSASTLLFSHPRMPKNTTDKATHPTGSYPQANHCSQGRSSTKAKSNWWARSFRLICLRRTTLRCSLAKAVKSVKPSIKINICTNMAPGSW